MIETRFPIFTDDDWQDLSDRLKLTPRQVEILQCLFAGMCDKKIAVELGIAVPTVRMHLKTLFKKFDLQDRIELILHVMAAHLDAHERKPIHHS